MKLFLYGLVCLIVGMASALPAQRAASGCSNVKGLCKFFYEQIGSNAYYCEANSSNSSTHCRRGAMIQ